MSDYEEPAYSVDQIDQLIAADAELFDVVRLVDPISLTVYAVRDGRLVAQPGGCHQVWGKEERCDNCISAKCFTKERRFSKFEFIDHDIYHVVAQPVAVDGERFVLEVVTASNDDVLLSAFGDNDFVDRITDFNRKVYVDELTGLSNRRCMNDRFALIAETAAREASALSVVMVDIDDFKTVNDTRGHLAGDEVLRAVACVLEEGFAPAEGDVLARYGGDEFFCAVKGVSCDELETRLKRVCDIVDARELGITLSMGAYHQDHARRTTCEKLVAKADEAMYGVKSSTKNGYAVRI